MTSNRSMMIASMIFIFSLASASICFAEITAGFAQSIFASKTNIVDGESITIFTILYNSEETDMLGALIFQIDDREIHRQDIKISPATTQTLSTTWQATQGEHIGKAFIITSGSSTAETMRLDSGVIKISVSSKPPPSAIQKAADSIISTVKQTASTTIPMAVNIASSTFATLENLRTEMAQAVDQSMPKRSGIVLGTSTNTLTDTVKEVPKTEEGQFGKVLDTTKHGILYVLNSRLLFYSILFGCILLIFQLLRYAIRDKSRANEY